MALLRLALAVFLIQSGLPQGGEAGSIHGFVINSATGLRFSGATVELSSIQHGKILSRSVKTDARGEFHFADVPPGSGYQLIATGEDVQPAAHGQRTWDDPWVPIRVGPRENVRDVQISVNPLTSIRGKILDNKKRPIANARVTALSRMYLQGRPVLREAAASISAPTGEYSLLNISPGVYYIRVMPANRDPAGYALLNTPSQFDRPSRGRPPALTGEPEGYPLTYFPGTSDIELAAAVHLPGGGAAKNMDVIISEVRTGRVRGSVRNDTIQVTAGIVILQRRSGAMESSWTRVAEIHEGRFDLRGVLPGSYVVWARTGEEGDQLWSRTAIDVRPGDNPAMEIAVVPAPEIAGQIRMEGWTEGIPPDLSLFSIHLVADALSPVDANLPSARLGVSGRSALSDKDGRFKLTGVAPMDYRLVVAPASGDPERTPVALRAVYAKSIRAADRNVSNDGLEVTVPFRDSLDILLAMDSGGLNGRVLNENRENAGAAIVVLVPDARHRKDLYLAVTASGTGRFQFQGIAPGTYKLFAWKEAPLGAWYDQDFLHDYENRGTPLRVAPGLSDYVELQWLR